MNIVEMARKAGIEFQAVTGIGGKRLVLTQGSTPLETIERFAQLVAEHEREMCAKIAENYPKYGEATAEEIRTRGQS